MMHRLRPLLPWLPALTWALLIWSLSAQPGGDSGGLSRAVLEFLQGIGLDLQAWFGAHASWVIRKLAHFTEYAILALFIYLGFRKSDVQPPWAQVWAAGMAWLYACSDEFHQSFIPRRVALFSDTLIDAAGAITAMLLVTLLLRLRRRPLRS